MPGIKTCLSVSLCETRPVHKLAIKMLKSAFCHVLKVTRSARRLLDLSYVLHKQLSVS